MDEIDATLDFKNVYILGHYVKDRTKDAQFIIISLRNNMMILNLISRYESIWFWMASKYFLLEYSSWPSNMHYLAGKQHDQPRSSPPQPDLTSNFPEVNQSLQEHRYPLLTGPSISQHSVFPTSI
ncbi:Structural maintenance of chromosomes protein 4 [Euphorbia peplus]|nr:Structural maintenance of chromosomes protein 4 [Euphorbia peplus]